MPHYFTYVQDEKYSDDTEWCNKIVLRHPDDCTWDALTRTFEQYLRACGYVFDSHAQLQLVNPTTEEKDHSQAVSAQVIQNLIKENTDLRALLEEYENGV